MLYAPSRVQTTIAADTRADLVTNLATALAGVGWVYISGEGTSDVAMRCAYNARNHYIALRIYDSGSSDCINIVLRDLAGNAAATTTWLLVGVGVVYNLRAHSHGFWMWTVGDHELNTGGRKFACAQLVAVPSYAAVADGCVGFLAGNATSNGDTNRRGSLRINPATLDNSGQNLATAYNGSFMVSTHTNGWWYVQTALRFYALAQTYAFSATCSNDWVNGDRFIIPAWVAWPDDVNNLWPKCRGELYDTLIECAPNGQGTVLSYDSHSWECISYNGLAVWERYPASSIFIATS